MKSFYGFLAIIISMLIFSACSSTTGPDDSFQGQRYGNWLTTSETTAEWVGSTQIKSTTQMAAAGDTTVIDDPSSAKILLHVNTYSNEFDVLIYDSTFTSGQIINRELVTGIQIESPDSNSFTDMRAYLGWAVDPTAPVIPKFQGTYICSDSTIATQAVLHYVFYKTPKPYTVLHTYTFNAEGFSPVLDAMACQ